MFLHADAIAEDGSAGIGTGRVDGYNSHGVILLAIEARKMIDECALPCSGCARQADHTGPATMRKQGLQQIGPSFGAILDRRNSSRQRAHVTGSEGVDPGLNVGIQGGVQANSVKQERRLGKPRAVANT